MPVGVRLKKQHATKINTGFEEDVQKVVLLGSVGDSPSFEGRGANCAPGETSIVGSVLRLFILPFIFFSMVAWGGAHTHTLSLNTQLNTQEELVYY